MYKLLKEIKAELRDVKGQNEYFLFELRAVKAEQERIRADFTRCLDMTARWQEIATKAVDMLAVKSANPAPGPAPLSSVLTTAAVPVRRAPVLARAHPLQANNRGSATGAGSANSAPRTLWRSEPPSATCGGPSASAHLVAKEGESTSVFNAAAVHILAFLTMEDANKMRLVCCEMRDAVTAWPWGKWVRQRRPWNVLLPTCAVQDVARWRACFPHASVARLGRRSTDDVFPLLVGVRALSMSNCLLVSDDSLAPLAGSIVELDISNCVHLTDGIFAHLCGLVTLSTKGCRGVTGTGFSHCASSLEELIISNSGCKSLAFTHLRNVRVLVARSMRYMSEEASVRYIRNLASVEVLDLRFSGFPDAAWVVLATLPSLRYLDMTLSDGASVATMRLLSALPHLELKF